MGYIPRQIDRDRLDAFYRLILNFYFLLIIDYLSFLSLSFFLFLEEGGCWTTDGNGETAIEGGYVAEKELRTEGLDRMARWMRRV